VLGAESARARDEAGVSTSTIGIGSDFQEDILNALAIQSGGRFWYIGEARIEDIIKEEFSGALSVLLERPAITIDLPKGVSIQQELNSLPKISGRYRVRPIKGNDAFSLAFRISVTPEQMEDSEVEIRELIAKLYGFSWPGFRASVSCPRLQASLNFHFPLSLAGSLRPPPDFFPALRGRLSAYATSRII